MSLAESFRLVGVGFAWRLLGPEGAGRALLEATASDDEQERMLAVIPLVKAGDRTIDLVEEAAQEGTLTPEGVRLLVDIGGRRSRAVLAEIATSPGKLGDVATSSIETLDRIEPLGREE